MWSKVAAPRGARKKRPPRKKDTVAMVGLEITGLQQSKSPFWYPTTVLGDCRGIYIVLEPCILAAWRPQGCCSNMAAVKVGPSFPQQMLKWLPCNVYRQGCSKRGKALWDFSYNRSGDVINRNSDATRSSPQALPFKLSSKGPLLIRHNSRKMEKISLRIC